MFQLLCFEKECGNMGQAVESLWSTLNQILCSSKTMRRYHKLVEKHQFSSFLYTLPQAQQKQDERVGGLSMGDVSDGWEFLVCERIRNLY